MKNINNIYIYIRKNFKKFISLLGVGIFASSFLIFTSISCASNQSSIETEDTTSELEKQLSNIKFSYPNNEIITSKFQNNHVQLTTNSNEAEWFRVDDLTIFDKYINGEINAWELYSSAAKIGSGQTIIIDSLDKAKSIFTLQKSDSNLQINTFNNVIIKNDIKFITKLKNISTKKQPLDPIQVKAISLNFSDLKYCFYLYKNDSKERIDEQLNSTGKFIFPQKLYDSININDFFNLKVYAYSKSNPDCYVSNSCTIKFVVEPIFIVEQVKSDLFGIRKNQFQENEESFNISIDKSQTLTIKNEASVASTNGGVVDSSKITYKWFWFLDDINNASPINDSIVSNNSIKISNKNIPLNIRNSMNDYNFKLYCLAQYNNLVSLKSKVFNLTFKLNEPITSNSITYLINPKNENLINKNYCYVRSSNRDITDWYISNSGSLTNLVHASPEIVNNIYRFKIPNNYNGELYIFGKSPKGFTNPIKFNVQNSNFNSTFKVGIKGIGKEEVEFNYLLNNNQYQNYVLQDDLKYIIDNGNESANRLITIAKKYSDYFINFLQSQRDLDLTQPQFNNLAPSVKYNLPKILNNINNIRVKQVNFINSQVDTNSQENRKDLPSNFYGMQIELCSKNTTNYFNDPFQFTIAIAANINLNNGNSYLSNSVNNIGITTNLFSNPNDELDFFINKNQTIISKDNFITRTIMDIDYTNTPSIIPSDIISNINNEYCQVLAYKILSRQHANSIMKSENLYPGIDFNIKNYSHDALGFINHHTVKWGNPWMMGWSKYSTILSSCAKADKSKPGFINISNNGGAAISMNLFDQTNFKNVPKIKIEKGKNLILQKLYGPNSQEVLENDFISPLGTLGIFSVNSFLAPTQNQGISYIGNRWEFFGSSNQNTAINNLDSIVKGLTWIIDTFNLNSIDFDYEYPDQSGQNDVYYKFLGKMKNALCALSIKTGKNYKMSVDINPDYVNGWCTNSLVDKYCNTYNIMAYDNLTCWNTDLAGGNSRARPVQGGANKIREVVTGNNNTVSLYNWLTQKNENVQKIPNYRLNGNIKGIDRSASYGSLNLNQNLINRGLKPEKIVFGLASYSIGWQIEGNGPLPELPGAFGVRTNGAVEGNQPGLSSFIHGIKNKTKQILFNPYMVDNYVWEPDRKFYHSMDFIESILYKRSVGDSKFKGYMVWTMNSQMSLPNDLFVNGVYDFSNVIEKNKTIFNLPIISTFSGLYDVQSIYDIWKDYLGNRFIEYFGQRWNVVNK